MDQNTCFKGIFFLVSVNSLKISEIFNMSLFCNFFRLLVDIVNDNEYHLRKITSIEKKMNKSYIKLTPRQVQQFVDNLK
jgi:hypothetical protein